MPHQELKPLPKATTKNEMYFSWYPGQSTGLVRSIIREAIVEVNKNLSQANQYGLHCQKLNYKHILYVVNALHVPEGFYVPEEKPAQHE